MNTETDTTLDQSHRRMPALMTLTFAGLILAITGPVAAQVACAHVDLVPNKILTLGPGIHSVTTTSTGSGYATTCCKHYVVDIFVPSNSSGTGSDLKSFAIFTSPGPSLVGPNDEVACKSTWGRTYVYQKSPAASIFSEIAHWEVAGVWDDDALVPCRIEYKANSVPLSSSLKPPASGTSIYRVVTVSKSGSSPVAVSVTAAHGQP